MPVEILAAGQGEAAERPAEHALAESDRIGHRHQHDFAVDAVAHLEIGEETAQVMGDQHPGRLIGVQRGLDHGLAPCPAVAEMQAVQLAVRAGRRGGEWMSFGSHGFFVSQC